MTFFARRAVTKVADGAFDALHAVLVSKQGVFAEAAVATARRAWRRSVGAVSTGRASRVVCAGALVASRTRQTDGVFSSLVIPSRAGDTPGSGAVGLETRLTGSTGGGVCRSRNGVDRAESASASRRVEASTWLTSVGVHRHRQRTQKQHQAHQDVCVSSSHRVGRQKKL